MMPLWHTWRTSESAKTWPAVKGHVVEAITARNSPSPPHVKYHCLYSYKVDDKTYSSLQIAPGAHYGDLARDLIKGQEITVYYNPADPAEALLDKTARPDDFGGVMVSLIGISILFAVAIVSIKDDRK